MAKCGICDSRKGKRNCRMTGNVVCSFCCGRSRSEDKCSGCEYISKARSERRYEQTPKYSPADMEFDLDKQQWTMAIESAIVEYDLKSNKCWRDKDAFRILELLLDKYHFRDDKAAWEKHAREEGLQEVLQSIIDDCDEVEDDELVKCIGAVYYVAKRRSGFYMQPRAYLDFIAQHVGPRVGKGVRLMPDPRC